MLAHKAASNQDHGTRLGKMKIKLFVLTFLAMHFFFLVSPVCAETTLNLMTWVGYAPDKQVQEFEKRMTEKYGETVKLKVHYINGYDEAFNLLRRGEGDVVVLVDHILHDGRYRFIANKLIIPLDRELTPNYRFVLDAYKPYVECDNDIYAAPIASGPYGLAYNTKYFDDPPKSWNILWDPHYIGKYAITNGIFEVNLYATALAMGYTRDSLGNFDGLNTPQFKARLRSLVENAESFWPGIDEAHHLQGLHLAASWGFSIPALRELGEEWKMAEPVEGSPTWIDVHTINQSLANKPLKRKLANEWINYTLSPDFQRKVIVEGIATPPVTTSAVAELSERQRNEFHLDDKDFIKKYRVVYPTIKKERNRNGIKYLWTEANKGIEKLVRTPVHPQ
jgi:spermidine/putrescine-binding protein